MGLKMLQSHDLSQLHWIGPVPGDIAEIEAYCRIFRAAEQLHCVLMDTLCNPLTGECSVSYDLPGEDKPLLEDKIVSVLGCVVSLLNKAREDVISGRSSIMNSFRATDLSSMEDELPPLALFRREMKRCSESLHVALESYLTPGDDRSLRVWRRLQRLKNVCYDSGFPRGDDFPCHMLFANWIPVYLSTSKEDIVSNHYDVAFWKGGQVTEEGLKWLMDKGFKTIVDLRSENVKDNFYQEVRDSATLSGAVEFIQIPVEVGTAPSMEQVERFATLVSDSKNKPIYLHSKEGVWRTSAMISRWRQYMSRCSHKTSSNQSNFPDLRSLNANGTGEMDVSANISGNTVTKDEDGLDENSMDKTHNLNTELNRQVSLNLENKNHKNTNGAYKISISSQGQTSGPSIDNQGGSLVSLSAEIDPLKAQFPPRNVFSKKEMSRFFKNKKFTSPNYSNTLPKKLESLPDSKEDPFQVKQTPENAGSAFVSRFVEEGSSNGSLRYENPSSMPQSLPFSNGSYLPDVSYTSVGPTLNKSAQVVDGAVVTDVATSMIDFLDKGTHVSKTAEKDQKNGVASIVSGDDGNEMIEGNMCASATGVVRVQSRKKAEMFLVRTDGFSCTREKVTESSLAFTHPSTQQQMLMWKSTPKTVLLLKKLGRELMEEAKEVPQANFVLI